MVNNSTKSLKRTTSYFKPLNKKHHGMCRCSYNNFWEKKYAIIIIIIIIEYSYSLLYVQLSEGERGDPINHFNPAIFLWLSQTTTLISNDTCRGVFCSMVWSKMLFQRKKFRT
jgi:hypothetical protein